MKIEKNIRICDLLDIYGNLLNKKQQEILKEYFANDISLNEIAENLNVSKQAVQDLIARATKKLEWYESRLGLLEIKKLISQLEGTIKDKQILKQLNELL